MVDSGTYEVFLKQAEENKPVATYESGKSFGELALLYNSPRAATIKCKEAGVLWALERKVRARARAHKHAHARHTCAVARARMPVHSTPRACTQLRS